jgi:lactose/L-arabinose transport system substrate-binding protein
MKRSVLARWSAPVLISAILGSIVAGGAAQERPTVTVWGWEFQKKVVDAILPLFNRKYPNITVDWKIMAPQQVRQNMLLALSSGTGAPDVFGAESAWLPQLLAVGGAVDITDRATPYLHKFNRFKWQDVTVNGRIFAMPWDSGPVALYYRRDVLEKAGLPSAPAQVAKLFATWSDYALLARKIHSTTGVYMFAHAKANNDARDFEKLAWQRGAGYFDEQGRVILDTRTENLEVLKFLAQFWKDDLAQDAQPWTPVWYKGFADGSMATHFGAVWMGGFLKTWIAPDAAGKWGVVPLPAWASGGVRTSNDGGSNLVLATQSKVKDAAWALLDFVTANREAQVTAWRAMDSFPSLEEAYSSPFARLDDSYFGGQAYRQVFVDLVKQIPVWYYTKDYPEANSVMAQEIVNVALGRKTPEQAIRDAAAEIRRRTGRQ